MCIIHEIKPGSVSTLRDFSSMSINKQIADIHRTAADRKFVPLPILAW